MDLEYRMIAPCYFGAESAAAFDIRRIGAKDVTVTDGRVAFTGGTDVLAAANLHSRCAERILLLLKTGRAMTFDELFNLAYSVPWEELMPADAAFPVKGSSLSSQLSSVPACQSIVKKAVVERLKKGHRVQALPESGGEYRIRFSIRKNEAEIMLDTSGEGLHKRGYRRQSTLAPIKETLACAMLDLGRIYPDSTVQDPFCGSGTLCIEAAMKALHIAPGPGAAALRRSGMPLCLPARSSAPAPPRWSRWCATRPLRRWVSILTRAPWPLPPTTPGWPGLMHMCAFTKPM